MSNQRRSIHFQIPARLEVLYQLDDKVKELMSDLPQLPDYETERYNFVLALHELCANITEHAYQDFQGVIDIKLHLQSEPKMLQAFVLDSGLPFEQGRTAAPNPAVLQEGGYGLFLIEQLVDEVHYRRNEKGNEWCLTRVIG